MNSRFTIEIAKHYSDASEPVGKQQVNRFMKTVLEKVKQSCILISLFSLCAIMAGCSSKPSDGEGKQAIQNQISQNSESRITLVGFHKSNGQLAEVNKVKLYSMEYEAEIAFSETCRWLTDGSFRRNYTFNTAAKPLSNLNETRSLLDHLTTGDSSLVVKGQRFTLAGTISFMKKENGWSVTGINISSATPIAGTTSPAPEIQPITQPSTSVANVSHVTEAASEPAPKQQPADETSISEVLQVTKVLMQIDGCKGQWSLERAKGPGSIPTESDLQEYFPNKLFPTHPPGGTYVINAYGKLPESSKYGKLDALKVKYHDQLYPKPHVDFDKMTPDQIRNFVVNDLRIIDSAKHQWALENNMSDVNKRISKGKDWFHATPTEDDLKP